MDFTTNAEVITAPNQVSAPSLNGVVINGIKVINLVPHNVNIFMDGHIVEVPPSGQMVRVISSRELSNTMIGVQGYRIRNPKIVGLPDAQDGVMYIVSGEVRAELSHYEERPDVVSPYAITTVKIGGKDVKCANALAF